MRTIEVNLYKLDELSEKAKEEARFNWLSAGDSDMSSEDNRRTLGAFQSVMPVSVKRWEYGGTPGHVRWEFDNGVSEQVQELRGQRLATYLWNNYKRHLFSGRYYSKSYQKPDGTYGIKSRRSKITIEHSCELTGYCVDEDILEPIYKFLEKPDDQTFGELISECFHSWLKSCEAMWEYEQSMEAFRETCEANDYEFYEDGRRA